MQPAGIPLPRSDVTADTLEPSGCTSVQRLFERRAAADPDAAALVWRGRSLTVRELNERANQVARRLVRRSVLPGDVVAFCVERSLELVVLVLGILKAGAVYLPIDPRQPAARGRLMLSDSGAPLLVTGGGARDAAREPAQGYPGEVLPLRRLLREAAGEARDDVELPSAPDLAYLLFTSGSTGRPKGVLGTHTGILNRLRWMDEHYPPGEDEAFCLKTSLGFVDSVWDIFQPLLFGGRLVVFPEGIQDDPDAFVGLLAEHGITRLSVVPSHLRALLEYFPDLGRRLPRLRILDVTGEGFPASLAERAARAFPGRTILNRYGTTEAPSVLLFDAGGHDEEAHGRYVSLGWPISRSRAYILDPDLRPVPAGEVGELCLSGAQVARGYLDRPELTRTRFVDDPFCGTPGERMYRTGDLARLAADGSIVCLGRADHQVTIRAHRVEIGEVEAVLGGHPGVRACAVAAYGPADQRRLAAFYVRADGGRAAPGVLARYLGERLPDYMVPADLREVSALPLLSSGKVDRVALEAAATDPERGGDAAPGGGVASEIAGLVARLLGRTRVGEDENLFRVGLDSLAVIELVAALRREFRAELTVDQVLAAPTCARLARLVGVPAKSALPPVRPRPDPSRAPMSYPQRLLWRLDRALGDQGYVYNDLWAIELRGPLDPGALAGALADLVARHAVFRTTFGLSGGEEVQHVREARGFDLPRIDLSRLHPGRRHEEVASCLRAERRRCFDLTRDLLLRGRLLTRGEEDHLLVLSAHHITEDAWSGELVNRDLGDAYNARIAGRPPAARPLSLSYADYSAWQSACVREGRFDRQLAYWTGRLRGLPRTDALRDREHGARPTFSGASRAVEVDAAVLARLKRVAGRAGTTPFTALLAAFFVALHRHTGASDLVVGSPIAHRHYPGVEGIVGFFPNMLVFRQEVDARRSFRELLAEVRRTALAAYAHQDLPFAELADRLGCPRGPRHPLVDVTFYMPGLSPRVGETLALQGLAARLHPLPEDCTYAKFDLSVAASERSGRLELRAFYNRGVLDEDTVDRLLARYRQVLGEVARDPGRRPGGPVRKRTAGTPPGQARRSG